MDRHIVEVSVIWNEEYNHFNVTMMCESPVFYKRSYEGDKELGYEKTCKFSAGRWWLEHAVSRRLKSAQKRYVKINKDRSHNIKSTYNLTHKI